MAASEGLRRVQLLAKRVAIFGPMAGLLFCGLFFAGTGSIGLPEIFISMVFPALVGGLIWVVGWVVQGFVSTDVPSRDFGS